MDKQQTRGLLVLVLLTVVILGSLTAVGGTDTVEVGGDAEVITGTGEGYNGIITVGMTVEDGAILSIEVVESEETEGIAVPAFEKITEAVVRNQSTDGVDMVSGATGSSAGVMEAIEDALSQM